jgi:nucleotide-binding universal stress UspA family protein
MKDPWLDTEAVVVGVDGSPPATAALRWAAREAACRGAPLRIVHAWLWPLYRVPLGPAPGAPAGAGLQAQAERVLRDASATARAVAPGVLVDTALVVGEAATALMRAAEGAQLLVVGHRGLGGFAGLLLGSTGIAASARATCPVVVVRGADRDEGPVVVGIDGSTSATGMLAEAARFARLHGSCLVLAHATTTPLGHHLAAGGGRDAESPGRREGRAVMAAAGAVHPQSWCSMQCTGILLV